MQGGAEREQRDQDQRDGAHRRGADQADRAQVRRGRRSPGRRGARRRSRPPRYPPRSRPPRYPPRSRPPRGRPATWPAAASGRAGRRRPRRRTPAPPRERRCTGRRCPTRRGTPIPACARAAAGSWPARSASAAAGTERPEQPEHRGELDPRRDEQPQRAGRVGDQVPCRLARVAAEGGVRPVVVGAAAEGRDQHIGRQHGGRYARHDDRGGDEPLPGHHARARHEEVEADPGDQQPHVLLDQQQGRQRDQRRPQPARLEALERDRRQHRGERDLVEVEGQRRGDRPAQQVHHGHQVGRDDRPLPATEGPAGEQPQRRDGQRERRGLRHQQGLRAVVDPVGRRQRREYRGPVVAEHREVRAEPVVHALDDRDPGLEMRVRPHRLVEDHQVVRRRCGRCSSGPARTPNRRLRSGPSAATPRPSGPGACPPSPRYRVRLRAWCPPWLRACPSQQTLSGRG